MILLKFCFHIKGHKSLADYGLGYMESSPGPQPETLLNMSPKGTVQAMYINIAYSKVKVCILVTFADL